MSRYVIMARENYPGAAIKELCRCNGRPYDIKDALSNFKVLGPLGTPIPKYNHVQILELDRRPNEQSTAKYSAYARKEHNCPTTASI